MPRVDRSGHPSSRGRGHLSVQPAHDFAADLARRFGTGAAPPDDLRVRVEAAFGAHAARRLLAPDSPDAVAAVLAACSGEDWPVVPLGAATQSKPAKQAAPAPENDRSPHGAPVLLSTARLNRVTEHEPADLVIGVQAGLPLQRLADRLAATHQWLPLDPPAHPQATIGAIAALARSGPLRAAHGTPRDMVLGVEVATGDGRLLRFGGRVVKNVAGYDGVRLLVGSRGTMGVITALYLRVRGVPRADRSLAIACGTGTAGASRAAGLAIAIRDAVACDALEVISPALMSAAGLRGGDAGWTVLVRLLGGEAAVAEGSDRVRSVAASAESGGRITDVDTGTWHSLARLEREATDVLRLHGPTTALADGLASASSAGGSGEAAGRRIAAHAADGVIRVWNPGSDAGRSIADPPPSGSWTGTYEGRRLVSARESGANASGPDTVGHVVPDLERRLQAVFDPAGILRPMGIL